MGNDKACEATPAAMAGRGLQKNNVASRFVQKALRCVICGHSSNNGECSHRDAEGQRESHYDLLYVSSLFLSVSVSNMRHLVAADGRAVDPAVAVVPFVSFVQFVDLVVVVSSFRVVRTIRGQCRCSCVFDGMNGIHWIG